MAHRSFFVIYICVSSTFCGPQLAWPKIIIHPCTNIGIELIGYDGLDSISLFKGNVIAENNIEINTSYKGLVLLVFSSGHSYPILHRDTLLRLKITTPSIRPSFPIGNENEFFYKSLEGRRTGNGKYALTKLLMKSEKLLDSSHDIHTMEELSAKKQEFHGFVEKHYHSLKHSYMIRRLIAQYFMMHEYINYHVKGAPTTDIRVKYQQAVLNGVRSWLQTLKPHIPDHEILNYCVSLYYNRSMISLAWVIINTFQDIAYCPGNQKTSFDFPDDLLVTNSNRKTKFVVGDITSKKTIVFVSDDCPVSLVAAVTLARKFPAQKNNPKLIIAPIQQLSDKHLGMSRMVSAGEMLFVDDEKWRAENLSTKIQLPLVKEIEVD